MHADQIDLAPETAAQLVHEQFPEYRRLPVTPLARSGTVNAIFRIGTEATARFPLRPEDPVELAARLERDARAMTELAGCCPVAAPLPLGVGRPGLSYPLPWSIQSWVDGETATPESHADSRSFATDLADLIQTLRSVPVHGRRFDGRGRGGALSDHDAWIAECLAESEGILDVGRLRDLWAFFRTLPPPALELMSHRDLIPANLLVRGEHLVGVLDTGDFGPADAALDLVAGWHLLDGTGRQVLRSRLGSDDREWLRGAAWAFEQAMGLVWYYRVTNPPMSALGRSTLRRLLADEVLLRAEA